VLYLFLFAAGARAPRASTHQALRPERAGLSSASVQTLNTRTYTHIHTTSQAFSTVLYISHSVAYVQFLRFGGDPRSACSLGLVNETWFRRLLGFICRCVIKRPGMIYLVRCLTLTGQHHLLPILCHHTHQLPADDSLHQCLFTGT